MLIFGIMPWVTVAIFLLGIAMRLIEWLSGDSVHKLPGKCNFKLALKRFLHHILKISLLHEKPIMWFAVSSFKSLVIAIIIWHLGLLFHFTSPPSFILAFIWFLIMINAVFFIVHQLKLPARSIVTPSDHFVWALIFLVGFFGSLMFYFEFLFPIYAFLLQLLIMAIPYTKLINSVGFIITAYFSAIRESRILRE